MATTAATAYIELRARLDRLERDLKEGEALTTRSAQNTTQKVGRKFSEFGSRASNLGNRMTLGMTVPLVALGAKAIDTAADFEKSMNTMGAVAGVPAPKLAELRDLAIDLGKKTVFSANEAAQAQLELSKAGISTADIMGGALKNTLDLATAGDLDLAQAATIAANAMNVFHLSGAQSLQAVDALSGAANASSADVDDLSEALQQGALAAFRAGLSVQETTAALAAFADAGLRGSDAGTSLKTFLLNLVPSTSKAEKTMKKLDVSFVDAQGNIKSLAEIAEILRVQLGDLTQAEQQAALKAMFGTDAYRAASVVMEQGAKGIERYTQATSDSGNAAKVAAGKMKGLPGLIERFKGTFETFLLKVGEGELQKVVENIANSVTGLLEAFMNLSPEMQATIVKVAVLGAAFGPALRVVGAFSSTIGGLTKVVGGVIGLFAKKTAATVADTAATTANTAATEANAVAQTGRLKALGSLGRAAGAAGAVFIAGKVAVDQWLKVQKESINAELEHQQSVQESHFLMVAWAKAVENGTMSMAEFTENARELAAGEEHTAVETAELASRFGQLRSQILATTIGIRGQRYAVQELTRDLKNIPTNIRTTVTVTQVGGADPNFNKPLPGRALGGPVRPLRSYVVGERGPEILTMGATGGFVTPNHALGGPIYGVLEIPGLGPAILRAYNGANRRQGRIARTRRVNVS